MKKFAVNYLLTPYLKYGTTSFFTYLFIISTVTSIIVSSFMKDYNTMKLIQLICMIINISGTLFLCTGAINIPWSEMTNEQKILYGSNDKNKLTFEQSCEWTRLYGTKVTTNEINSKLQVR